MTAVWIALAAAALVLGWYAAWLAGQVSEAAWPEEAPLQLREERARDQRLNRLVRLVGARDVHEAHRVVGDLAHRLADGRPLDPVVARFLAAPPLADPERYRRELAAVLARMEAS